VRKNLRQNKLAGKSGKIALAASGRAASTAMLYLLKDLLGESHQLIVLHLTETAAGKKLVEQHCKKLGLEYKTLKAKKDRLKQLKTLARKAKANKLAWGLTLEDEAGLALQQLFEGRVKKGKEGFLIAPMTTSPEKEIETYLKVKKVKFLKEKKKKSELSEYRQLLEKFEKGQPGTKFQLMSSIQRLRQLKTKP
jgi:tRNA(Ile)-lysidine synthase TilS/MesJ